MAVDTNNMNLDQLEEYKKLLQHKQELQIQRRQEIDSKLLDNMKGSMPLSEAPYSHQIPSSAFENPTNVQRQNAFNELLKTGKTKDQIRMALDLQKRIGPGLLKTFKETAGEEIGGLAGGIAGAKLATVIGAFIPVPEELITIPAFAALGAYLGGGAGQTLQDVKDPFEEPSWIRAHKAGKRQAAWEIGGRAVVGVLRKGLPIVKKSVDPLHDYPDIAETFNRHGGFFTPRQRDLRKTIRAAEELSRGSFGGGAIFDGFDTKQQATALATSLGIIDTLADDATRNADDLGNALADIFVRKGEQAVKFRGQRQALLDDFFDILYKKAGKMSPWHKVSTEPIRKLAEKTIESDRRLGGSLLSGKGRTTLKNILGEGEKGLKLAPQLSIDDMRSVRSQYTKIARQFTVEADPSDIIFFQLAEVADDILFNPGAQAGLDEATATFLRNINAVYGPSRELFHNEFVKRVVKNLINKPGKSLGIVYKDFDYKRLKTIRDLLISPVPKASGVTTTKKTIAKELRTLRQSLREMPRGEKLAAKMMVNAAEGRALWKQLNQTWLRELILNCFDVNTGMMNIKKLDNAIKSIPDNTFKLMFPGNKSKSVKGIIRLFESISPPKRGFVSVFGKGIEFGGGHRVMTSIYPFSGVGITSGLALGISPSAFAALATNPKATKLLTLGFKEHPGSVRLGPIAARLIKILREDMARDKRMAIEEQKRLEQRFRMEGAKIKAPTLHEQRGYGGRGF